MSETQHFVTGRPVDVDWTSEPAKSKKLFSPPPGPLFRVTRSQALVRLVEIEFFERSHAVFVPFRNDTMRSVRKNPADIAGSSRIDDGKRSGRRE